MDQRARWGSGLAIVGVSSSGLSGGPAARIFRRLLGNPVALVALAALSALALAGVMAPMLAPFDPLEMGTGGSLSAPDARHWLGTDLFGRDILSRIMHGARISLAVAVAAVALSSLAGVTLGLVAGYFGKWLETVIMRALDLLLAFPGVFLALIIVALLGPGIVNAVVAVSISAIPTYARTVRASVLAAKQNLYVDAARTAGADDLRIVFVHILPNVAAPVVVLATLGFGWALLSISSLSFLGLGAQPPAPEWGAMLYESRGYLRDAWWATTFPGLAIMVAVMAMNRLGDGLRDAMDPRLQSDGR